MGYTQIIDDSVFGWFAGMSIYVVREHRAAGSREKSIRRARALALSRVRVRVCGYTPAFACDARVSFAWLVVVYYVDGVFFFLLSFFY